MSVLSLKASSPIPITGTVPELGPGIDLGIVTFHSEKDFPLIKVALVPPASYLYLIPVIGSV